MTIYGIDIIALIASMMVAATPILLAATGELVAEKSGVLNLGVEGMMIVGAICGFAAAVSSGSPVLGFLAAAVGGAVMALLFAVLTQYLLSNQVATGLALTMFGLGLSALIGQGYQGVKPPLTEKIDKMMHFEARTFATSINEEAYPRRFDAIEPLIPVLRDPNWERRASIILAMYGSTKEMPEIYATLEDALKRDDLPESIRRHVESAIARRKFIVDTHYKVDIKL